MHLEPLAQVIGGRTEPTDDFWGDTRSIIRIDNAYSGTELVRGLDEFSHLEVVFYFHAAVSTPHAPTRHPRGNQAWPEVGLFAQRNARRPNHLGVSRCRLLKIDGQDLHVEELDAIDGTPVLDIKPWFSEFGPRGEVKQAPWSEEMLLNYFAPERQP